MSVSLLQNTLLVGLGTVAGCLVAAVAVFVTSWCSSERWAHWFPVLAGANLLLPHFLVMASWMAWLGADGAMPGDSGRWLYSLPGAIVILALVYWPICFFFLWGRRGVVLRFVMSLDPCHRSGSLSRLVWALTWRPLACGALLTFGMAVNNLAVPGLLQVRVLPEEILVRFNTNLDLGGAAMIGAPLVIVAVILTGFIVRQEWSSDVGPVPSVPSFLRQRLGRGMVIVGRFVSLGVILLGLAFPLGYLLATRVTWTDLTSAYRASLPALGYSWLFAMLGATVVMGLGWGLRHFRWARWFWCLMIVPGTLLGASIAEMNSWTYARGWELSGWVVIGALGLRFLGLGVGGAFVAEAGRDARLIGLAKLDGCGAVWRFRHCLWPQIGAVMMTVWWLVYLLCLWEVEVLIFLIPPGVETVALRVFNLLHYGHNSQVNASCLLLLGLGLLPLLGWGLIRFMSRSLRGRQLQSAFLGCLLMALVGVGCGGESGAEPGLQSQFFASVESVGKKGTGVGQFNKPRSLAVGPGDEVFAVDMTGRVQRFDAEGEYISFWQMPETERGRPKGMACDRDGLVVVVEPHYARINHFTPAGELVWQWGQSGKNDAQLAFPRAVAVHSSGDLFVTEFQQVERVQRFLSRGVDWVLSFGTAGSGDGDFNRAEGIGIDRNDRLFVADSCNHRVQIFREDGMLLGQYGRPGKGLGEMSYPYDVKIDEDGFQFVCEFGNSRIQVFDREHRPVEIIGGPGSQLGQFSNPWSIAMDSVGNLWVADSGNHRLQKLVRHRPKP